ncbi:hypothetical protein [Gordonia hydrophobica]|uniref:Uncharacterized protein n=1 Tax=Gordonia hydrophobica TaxID=40516 RepID=A0ABZ2U267_9ACTN|nr:hypothetical protein [Gordonia hydrophobica]MBM7366769.1 hypothetical protein [Gordonia hydrophobica]
MSVWQAAFGVEPAEPAPVGADRWARAVDLGARGRAAAARAIVADLLRDPRVPDEIRALACATRASLTRQAGGHALARADDGAGVRAATGLHGRWGVAARLDALIGLAADGLGIGAFSASATLLDRAAAEMADAPAAIAQDWLCVGRPRLRLAWVRTELALYSGAPGADRCAAEAMELAAAAPSSRHRIKTDLIAAAASAAAGDVAHAATEAERLSDACRAAGLLPLEWAAHTMLAGLRPGPTASSVADRLRGDMVTLGMAFEPLPGTTATDRYA